MAATVARGTTFTDGQSNITVATFNPLLTAATIAGIDRANVGIAAGVATRGASPGNPQPQEVSQDGQSNRLSSYLAGAWVPALSNVMKVIAASDILAGQVVMPSGDAVNGVPQVAPCMSAKKTSALGVACRNIATGSTDFVVVRGTCKALAASAITAGHPVRVSLTNGQLEDAGAAGTGYGRECVGVALEADSGGAVWIQLRAR